MSLIIRISLLLLSSLPLMAADTPSAADVLNHWVGGKWVGSGDFIDSAYSKANHSSAVTKCVWSPDHVFVVCDQDINFGGTPMRDLSIYAYSSKTSKFYFYGVSLGEEQPRHTALDIADNGDRWTYSSSNDIKGKRVEFRTVNQFHGPDAVEWWTEFSVDGGKTWTKTGGGKETREK
ncbi:MAG TPA: hypothetical protein VKB58_12165 [Terriglobales bacterium]|nr:hypothetical protein [Terriglobales bacterium]